MTSTTITTTITTIKEELSDPKLRPTLAVVLSAIPAWSAVYALYGYVIILEQQQLPTLANAIATTGAALALVVSVIIAVIGTCFLVSMIGIVVYMLTHAIAEKLTARLNSMSDPHDRASSTGPPSSCWPPQALSSQEHWHSTLTRMRSSGSPAPSS